MKRIELLLLDVDGTLTDGKIYYAQEEMKAFNIKDGLGLRVWHFLGRKSAIITGRRSSVVERRAKELGISYIFMGIEKKGEIAKRLQEELNLTQEQIVSVGDDLNDLSMFAQSGLSFAPQDCAKQILPFVKQVSCNGGEGAVREVIEILLEREGLQEKWFETFN